MRPRLSIHLRYTPLAWVAAAGLALLGTVGVSSAFATPSPYWSLSSRAVPANFRPGTEGRLSDNGNTGPVIVVTASDLGDEPISGEKVPITLTDTLPKGLTATEVAGAETFDSANTLTCDPPSTVPLRCTFSGTISPGDGVSLRIAVKVTETGEAVLQNQVSASGGEGAGGLVVRAESIDRPVKISAEEPSFGVENYELKPEEEGGTADPQAGSHPFQLTTTLALNQNAHEEPVALPRNLSFDLPPGLIGDPKATQQCTEGQFDAIIEGVFGQSRPINGCPANTAVGIAEVEIDEPHTYHSEPAQLTVPVFNLEPAQGEPARFGFDPLKVPIVLDTSVRTGKNYSVVVTAKNTPQIAGLISSKVTIWGVPASTSHNSLRGWACAGVRFGFPSCTEQQHNEEEEGPMPEKPFLSLPTSCGTPLRAPMEAQSWVPGAALVGPYESKFAESAEGSEGLQGCESEGLKFEPGLIGEVPSGEEAPLPGVELPETQSGSTPAAFTVRISVPQPETASGLAESAVKSTTVALPPGMQLNPAAANRLVACSVLDVGFTGFEEGVPESAQTENDHFTEGPAACPDAAKVGAVRIKSPDLTNELTGAVYLAAQDTNPFGPPLVLYLIAEDPVSGVRVKLAGTTTPNEQTGQLFSTFEDTPEVPFEHLTLSFFGGGGASLSTPPLCGSYAATASFVPWSGQAAHPSSASFNITSGPGGGGCATNPLPFSPSFNADPTNVQAGTFTGFPLTIYRPDGDQGLTGITVHLPEGVAAMLSSVMPCPIEQADLAQCEPESLVGHSTTLTGLGSEPYSLGGSVYLTTGFDNAPFGLSVATPAVAGPFNLGTVIANSTIQVNPTTAAVTVTAVQSHLLDAGGGITELGSPLPTIVKGVPVQLKAISVRVDRPNFQFNPTSCNAMSTSATLTGAEGAVAPVSSPFQVANCASLPFHPKLTASVAAQGSKANGVSFTVKVTSSGLGVAGIAKVDLAIPAVLPSRLTTIQKACPEAVFAANPATCDEGSVIGKGIIHTPVLKNPLSGPAYLVSHGNAAFPDVEFLLQGEGITLLLDGKTDIKKGITYSRFESNPDAPFTTFETQLPAGPHSALTDVVPTSKNYNLCGTSLQIPLEMTGQNGAFFKETTNVAIIGCQSVKAFKASRAQRLAKALAACKKKYRHSKKKRVACEKQAHRKYGPKTAAKSKKKK